MRIPLSPTQLRIVEMVAQGMANKAIARELDITGKTVSAHLHRACEKLGAKNRVQLAAHCAVSGGAIVDRVWNANEGIDVPPLWAHVGPMTPPGFTIYNIVKALP